MDAILIEASAPENFKYKLAIAIAIDIDIDIAWRGVAWRGARTMATLPCSPSAISTRTDTREYSI
tara:strand:+ start:13452 stop:13646 length:195 start_codon:yes stop_codon:yes gene_type:complete